MKIYVLKFSVLATRSWVDVGETGASSPLFQSTASSLSIKIAT